MTSSRIVELANSIQTNTVKLDQYCSSHGVPSPSFDIDTPLEIHLPDDIEACRVAILEATDELHALTMGPVQAVNWLRVFPNGQILHNENSNR